MAGLTLTAPIDPKADIASDYVTNTKNKSKTRLKTGATSCCQRNAFGNVLNDTADAHDRAVLALVRIVVVHVAP